MCFLQCSPADASLIGMAIPNVLAHKWGGGGGPPWGEFNPPPTEGVQGVLNHNYIAVNQSSRSITNGQAPDGKLKFLL